LPTYPIINTKTGEQKEVTLSVTEWEIFKKENPDFIRDWSDPSTAPNGIAEPGEWKDKLNKKHPSWNEVLKKANKSAGSKTQMNLGK
jgi:hypothetical protein